MSNYSFFDGKSVLVTGGAGFIGSHLVERLMKTGLKKIVVLDSFRYGDPRNLGEFASDDRLQSIKHSLSSQSKPFLNEILRDVDCLFHLAAEKHNQSKDKPEDVLDSNIDGTLHLFTSAAACNVKHILFTSSLYVYGRWNTNPTAEEMTPTVPDTVYGISKLAGEGLLRYALDLNPAMRGNILRYYFIYGPKQFAGQGYKSVILKNFERLINGQAPVIFGDGSQKLDYVFVDDAVEATLNVMASNQTNEVFNISSGCATSVNELTDLMLRVARKEIPPEFGPKDWTAGTSRSGLNQKIRRAVDWSPKIGLEEGLTRTLAWLK